MSAVVATSGVSTPPPGAPARIAPDRRVGGACAEVARRLNAPVGFVRLLTLVGLEFLPKALLVYLAAVLLLPQGGRRWPGVTNLVGALRYGALLGAFRPLNLGGISLFESFQQPPTLWITEGGLCAAILTALLVPTPRADVERYERQVVGAALGLLLLTGLLLAGAGLLPQVRWERVAAASAIAIGGALTVAARRIDVRAWLLPAAVAAAGLVMLTVSGARLQGGFGHLTVRTASAQALRPRYRRAVGTLTVNLSGMNTHGRVVNLDLSVGIGHLTVVYPAEAAVEIDVRVGRGQLIPSGTGPETALGLHERLSGVSPLAPRHPTVRLHIDAAVGIGTLELQRVGGYSERGSI